MISYRRESLTLCPKDPLAFAFVSRKVRSKTRNGAPVRSSLRILLCLALIAPTIPALAQPADGGNRRENAPNPAPRPPRPAPDAVTEQTLDLPGRKLDFMATVGFVRLLDDKGAPEADINTTAYTLKGADPATRPVTFVVNGGPGMASAWLQMGAVGPWRVPMLSQPSASPALQPNADTWLDFTDLVFIDPVGTGYSRFVNTADDVRKRLWSVNGDIESLSQAIRRWLDKSGRIASPKYLLGESYGGFRAPRLEQRLAAQYGVGLQGLVMVSPILDYGNRSGALDLLERAAELPSMAAAVRAEHGQAVTRADLKDAEDYAAGPFLTDVLHGVADPAATARVVDKVSALTGLDPAEVRHRRGLIGSFVFIHDHDRASGRTDSVYDTTVSTPDAFPENPYGRVLDPMLDGLRAPLTEGVLAVYDRLHWHPEGGIYELVSDAAGRQWEYGNQFNRPQSFDALRQDLALDPGLHVIIAHGLFDLVCPYFGTQLLLNQIPAASGADRVKLVTFPGGHMFYSRDDSRAGLRDEAAKLMGAAP